MTKRKPCSKILSGLHNLGSSSFHLWYWQKKSQFMCPINTFSWACCSFLFIFFPRRCGVTGEEKRKKSYACRYLNSIDFTHKKKNVISVLMARYENLPECERVDLTRKLYREIYIAWKEGLWKLFWNWWVKMVTFPRTTSFEGFDCYIKGFFFIFITLFFFFLKFCILLNVLKKICTYLTHILLNLFLQCLEL